MSVERDWIGNSRSAHATLGARNYAQNERQQHDYYATHPKATELLCEIETFSPDIWECACGEGHIAETLKKHGYNVLCTDLIDRGYGKGGVDFLNCNGNFDGDIITNPPYKFAKEFVEKSLALVTEGHKVAMFLKLQFLESKSRRELFKKYPPKVIYVSSGRLQCAMNGDFEKYSKSNAVTYAWFIWEKGFQGEPVIRWFN